MTFDTTHGTRGRRQPKGRVFRWVNSLVARRARSRSRVMGMDVVVLRTVGRKSGEERTTPVAWFPDEGDSILVVASAAGAAKHPAWFLNMAANPDRVSMERVGQPRTPALVEQLHGEERAQAWARIVAASPNFAGYETATDREIPVVRLTPRPA